MLLNDQEIQQVDKSLAYKRKLLLINESCEPNNGLVWSRTCTIIKRKDKYLSRIVQFVLSKLFYPTTTAAYGPEISGSNTQMVASQ